MKNSPHELKVQLVWGIFVRWGALALADRESVSPVVTVRKVYNAMVRKYGLPDQINIETGRELKKTFKERKEIENKNKENQE